MPTGEYYHGIALFHRDRDQKGYNYDWADLAPWERQIWGVRQDYELAGKKWQGVVDMVKPTVYDVLTQRLPKE